MSFRRIAIGNQIYLSLIDSDRFKTNYMSVNFITGLDRRSASKNALLMQVLKRGCKKYPTMLELNKKLDMLYSSKIGARVMKIGEAQVFGLSADMLDNAYALDGSDITAQVLDILDELLNRPLAECGAFKTEYVEGEKKNLKDNIAAKVNNKTSYAIERCYAEMCKGEAFGLSELGEAEDVDAITPASLYEHYQTVLRDCCIEAFFVGRFDEAALTEKLKSLFAGLQRGDIAGVDTRIVRRTDSVREYVEEMAVSQGKLSIGFRTGTVISDGNWATFALFNELYGGSPTSLLFENVREKLSLCYYCRSMPEGQKGVMQVACGIEVDNKQKAQDEILAQLEVVKRGEYPDKKVEEAKKGLTNGYKELYDSSLTLELWYLRRILADMVISPDDASAQVMAVTKEQITQVANKITLDTIYFLKGTLKDEEGAQ